MDISSVSSADAATYTDSLSEVLGKEDFLTLLVAQLENQDPLNPQDSADFTAQLAQFSSLEQLFSINEGVQMLQILELSNSNTMALTLIGKEIVATGEAISVTEGEANTVSYDLAEDASKVYVKIYDSDGTEVATVEIGGQNEGVHEFIWDGRLEDGSMAADGEYTFEIVASDIDGEPVEATSYIEGLVTGIKFEDGLTYAVVDGRLIPVGEITAVNDVQV